MRTRVLVTAIILALAAFVLAPATASAQLSGAGFKGGVNFSNVDITGDDAGLSFDQRIGGTGGYFVSWDMNTDFGLQVETLFSQKGTHVKDAFAGPGLKVRIDYIEVPLLARAHLRPSDRTRVHFFGGPALAGRLYDSQKIGGRKLSDQDRIELRNYDVGITVGGALDYNRFIIDARYTHGLLNLNVGDQPDDFEVKTRTFTTMLGYRFW